MSNARPLDVSTRGMNYSKQQPDRTHFTPAQKRSLLRGLRKREAFLRKADERLAQSFQKLDAATASTDTKEN